MTESKFIENITIFKLAYCRISKIITKSKKNKHDINEINFAENKKLNST